MLSPVRSLRRASSHGHELPRVPALGPLYDRGAAFRESMLWMITGRPKAGKSFFAQWWASEVAKAGREAGTPAPGIYFFLDGTPFTAAVRQAAWATGHQTKDIAAALDGPGVGFYEDALFDLSHDITFVYDKRPELPDIKQALDAYVELWDRWPAWMIFDNLRNMTAGDESHESMKFVLSELQGLAYATGASIGVLHHATESGVKDYSRPPRVSETDGKVTQYPEMVLSVAKEPGSDRFSVAVAAQRDGGDSDPNAESPIKLFADFSRMAFAAHPPITTTSWSPYE